jgi:DNA-binding NarL/FixJ family response regulator
MRVHAPRHGLRTEGRPVRPKTRERSNHALALSPEPKRTSRARSPRVCILSNHPLVLEILHQALERGGLPAKTLRLGKAVSPGASQISFPSADIYVVDGQDPFAVVRVGTLRKKLPKARVIVLAEKFTDGNAFPFLELGVKGLLDFSTVPQNLGQAITTVARGDFWVDRNLLSRFLDCVLQRGRRRHSTVGPHRLSRREKEVLQALLESLSNKEMAKELNISERTVKFHVSNLLTKFGVRRRNELIMLHLQNW